MSCVSIISNGIKSVRWATPCDGKEECFDGKDEKGCDSPIWLLPVILLVAIFFLLCSQFLFSYKYIRKEVEEIRKNTNLKCQEPLQSISCRLQKHIYIAKLLDQEDQKGLETLMVKEIETHQSEGKALCCFKVKVAGL